MQPLGERKRGWRSLCAQADPSEPVLRWSVSTGRSRTAVRDKRCPVDVKSFVPLVTAAHERQLALRRQQDPWYARRVRPNRRPARLEGRTMANVKIGPLAPSIYCVHKRIAVQIAAAVDADQPDWRNRLAAVIARHLDAAAQNRTCGPRTP
jgi:hypothetical protein